MTWLRAALSEPCLLALAVLTAVAWAAVLVLWRLVPRRG